MFKWKNFSESLLVRSVYLITIPIVLVQIIGIIIFFDMTLNQQKAYQYSL